MPTVRPSAGLRPDPLSCRWPIVRSVGFLLYFSGLLGPGLLGPLSGALPAGEPPTGALAVGDVGADARTAFLEAHCLDCHAGADAPMSVELDGLEFSSDDRQRLRLWESIYRAVECREMPPAEADPPADEERAAFLSQLAVDLRGASQQLHREQGRVPLRRLSRFAYEQQLHALLAIDLPIVPLLPADPPTHGFEETAEGQRLSALHLERYSAAADAALAAALRLAPKPTPIDRRFRYHDDPEIRKNLDTPAGTITDPVAQSKHTVLFRELPDAIVLFSDGYSPTDLRELRIEQAGSYRIRIAAYGFQSHGRPVTMRVEALNYGSGDRLLDYFEMPADQPREVELTASLRKDDRLRIAPHDSGYDDRGQTVWNVPASEFTGVGLAVQWIEVKGPLDDQWPPPSTQRVLGDVAVVAVRDGDGQSRWRNNEPVGFVAAPVDAKVDLSREVTRFAEAAFRRPLEPDEAEPYIALGQSLLDQGEDFLTALTTAYRGVLTAPQCLFLREPVGRLSDHALAARLSFFLWNGPPDAELRALATAGRLQDDGVLASQVDRLIDDPRSRVFVAQFLSQWLELRRLDDTSPDGELYPEYDLILRRAMQRETEQFFAELLRLDGSCLDLLDSDYVMLNRRMAQHYGLEGADDEQFRRVSLPANHLRGGLLTQASILKLTANGTVTSPVLRGAWVLRQLLGQTPPPPPPTVGTIEPDTRGSTTIREQLARHQQDPSCAGCHSKIDPPGFALECFDVIGGSRDRYRVKGHGADRPAIKLRGQDIWQYHLGAPVDASGTTIDGTAFDDVRGLQRWLLDQPRPFLENLVNKLVTYGTGAPPDFADREMLGELLDAQRGSRFGLRSLIKAIVLSPIFRER